MFHFDWPWLGLLLPLPIFMRWIPFYGKAIHHNVPELYFPAIDRLERAFSADQKEDVQSKKLFFSLLSLFWVCLTLAMMQPEMVDQFKVEKNKGYDLMMAVDISVSMQALDFSTDVKTISRLDVTKEVVGKFVLSRQGDRVGLILFGENAYLHTPLTLDTHSVSRMLNDIAAGMAGSATAIGDAIGVSVKTLRNRPEGSRVLILLTDGEDNASSIPPLEAAKLAKQYGIRIYTIGIGRKGKVPFPNGFGGYGMVEVSIDEDLLKQIAKITDGQYFYATDQKMLELIYSKIDELEKTESNETLFLVRESLYRYPLSLALIFLLILFFYQLWHRRAACEF